MPKKEKKKKISTVYMCSAYKDIKNESKETNFLKYKIYQI